MKNILVFFGGSSPERDVSVITGVLTLNSLDKSEYNPIPIFISETGEFYTGSELNNLNFYKNLNLKKAKRCALISGDNRLYLLKGKKLKEQCEIYCAINCTHGQMGEDGTLSGILKYSQIPEVAPEIFAQALAIDKHFSKVMLNALQVPTVEGATINRKDFFEDSNAQVDIIANKLGYPVIIKPARLGSSIGIEKAENGDQLFIAITRAFRYDDKVVCEKYLKNSRDINCAVYKMGEKIETSKLEEALKKSDILSFIDKYGGGKLENSKKSYPNDLSTEIQEQIKEYARLAYTQLEFEGIVRFDFLVCEDRVYLNEINAIPGSLAYYLFCDKLSEFTKLLSGLIEHKVRQISKRSTLITRFESSILNGDWKSIKK